MRKLTLGAVALIALGIILIAYAVSTGEAKVYIFVFIPVFTGGTLTAFGGTLLLFLGIFLFFFSLAGPGGFDTVEPARAAPRAGAPRTPGTKFGGVVLLGPIPIVFGSDKKIAKWMLVVALILVILLVVIMWYFATQPLR